MREVLGLSESDLWEPVCQTISATEEARRRVAHDASLSWFQSELGDLFRLVARTVVYRPWAYALLGLILLGYATWRRDGFLLAFLGSGLLYEASYFIGAAAPDFRYSYWMITCVCVAAITVAGRRMHEGSRS